MVNYLGVEGKIRYRVQLKAFNEGGEMKVDGTQLIVDNADAVTLCLVAATNFVSYNDVSADQIRRAEEYIENINGKSYNDLKTSAVNDYRTLFDRVKLELPETDNSYLPTDKRMKVFENNSDPDLAALCYNFGRYVLISSSRQGTEAANLQGIWN